MPKTKPPRETADEALERLRRECPDEAETARVMAVAWAIMFGVVVDEPKEKRDGN